MTAQEWLNKWDDILYKCEKNADYNKELIKLIKEIQEESFLEGVKAERCSKGEPTWTYRDEIG